MKVLEQYELRKDNLNKIEQLQKDIDKKLKELDSEAIKLYVPKLTYLGQDYLTYLNSRDKNYVWSTFDALIIKKNFWGRWKLYIKWGSIFRNATYGNLETALYNENINIKKLDDKSLDRLQYSLENLYEELTEENK